MVMGMLRSAMTAPIAFKVESQAHARILAGTIDRSFHIDKEENIQWQEEEFFATGVQV
jgi:hypothetical protein